MSLRGSATPRQAVVHWPIKLQGLFEARVGIKQFLDNTPRLQAEQEAYDELGKRFIQLQRGGRRAR